MKLTNWDEIFDEDYYRLFQTKDNSLKEAEFIEKSLKLQKGDSVLDIGCGDGKHLLQLSKAGYENLVGIDFSKKIIEIAEKKRREMNFDGVSFVEGDFLNHEFDELFDKSYSFFSGFGYYTDDENEKYIEKVSEILKPGGIFLLDVFNYFYFIKNFQQEIEFEKDGLHFLNKNKFDVEKSVNYSENIITNKETGEVKKYSYAMRYYSAIEIINILERHGFSVKDTFGDYEGGEFTLESKRMIFVCEKKP